MSSKARNPVGISAGLNDVLDAGEGKLGQEIAKRVNALRVAAPTVLMAVVCTVPEGTKQGVHTERPVLAANSEIERRCRERGFEVIDVNMVVGSIGHSPAFEWDGIHVSPRLGNKAGWRFGGRVVAFFSAPREVKEGKLADNCEAKDMCTLNAGRQPGLGLTEKPIDIAGNIDKDDLSEKNTANTLLRDKNPYVESEREEQMQ